jgi:hypothetical protein
LGQYSAANTTEPLALLQAFSTWFAPKAVIYVGTDERDAETFFAPVQAQRTVYHALNFSRILRAHGVDNNYASYAVERLLFYGAAAHAETTGNSHAWFRQACFPAFVTMQRIREQSTQHTAPCGVEVDGVFFGKACGATGRPRCGAMHLVPRISSCSRVTEPKRSQIECTGQLSSFSFI